MKRILFLLWVVWAFSLNSFDYSQWTRFVKLNYIPSSENTWLFLGKLRGGYVFVIALSVNGNVAREKVVLRGPDGRIRRYDRSVEDFIFDGNKFYYSSSHLDYKITGYGLELRGKNPDLHIHGKPFGKFVSTDISLRSRGVVFYFPMWEWKFRGSFVIDGMRFRLEWVLPIHVSGKLSGRIITGMTDDYSFFFFKPRSGDPVLVFERNFNFLPFDGGITGKERGRDFVFTGRGKALYLKINMTPSCRDLAPVSYRIFYHPPYQVLPGNGLIFCQQDEN